MADTTLHIGYAGVSTDAQGLINLCARDWADAVDHLRAGDVVTVTRLPFGAQHLRPAGCSRTHPVRRRVLAQLC